MLEEKGTTIDTLITRDTTASERKYSKTYNIGDIMSPEKDYHKIGLKQNELYEVIDKSEGGRNKLIVKSISDKSISDNKCQPQTIEFSPMIYKKLRLYRPERSELAVGDHVRITRNDPELNLVNGDRMIVKQINIKESYIVLSHRSEDREKTPSQNRNVKLPTNKPLHIDYAYATTVHSSQGLTADRVLIDIKTKSPTPSKDIYYVAISRARKDARIYTDNIKIPS